MCPSESTASIIDTCRHKIQQLLVKLTTEPNNCGVLQQLAQCYVIVGDADKALSIFKKFMQLMEQQVNYLTPFCQLLHKHNFSVQAAKLYADYCHLFPSNSSLFYNHAFYLRFAGEYKQAISQYEKALKLNISEPEEVFLNIAVIYSDHLRQENAAEKALLQALQKKSDYVPALYNLANLAEERGDKKRAEGLFRQIVDVDPNYYQAYARLADVLTFKDENDPIIKHMQRAISLNNLDRETKANLYFALGKAFDECRLFAQAFDYFNHANQLNGSMMPSYNPDFFEQKIQQIIQTIDQPWLAANSLTNDAEPVFICGMFRSGSTLIEQILAQHSQVTAGGEIDFFYRQLKNIYPKQFAQNSAADLKELAQGYLQYCQQCFPTATVLTDKRPDNYQYLGLLKALFPRAKFVYTRRNKVDNSLSIYFLRLGSAMNYANQLEHIEHYYQQQEVLMAHWQQMFGQDIYTLDYDQLVARPEETLSPLLSFLDLEYQPQLMHFHQSTNTVKTASAWQVRQPLYQHASGRRKNYIDFLPRLSK